MRSGKRRMKAAVCTLLSLILCLAALAGCGEKEQGMQSSRDSHTKDAPSERTVFAMDTVMNLRVYGADGEKVLDDAEAEIARLDALLRRGDASSEIYRLNSERTAEVSEDTAELLKAALSISESTEGVFDISIAPVMDLWGFYGQQFHVPASEEIKATLPDVDWRGISLNGNTVSLQDGIQIDLGGIAKGFLSNRIMEIYRQNGIKSGLVSLGGNVQVLGTKTDGSQWNIAIQDPDDESAYAGTIKASDKAVITSGSYQRYFEENGVKYHHIIDPKTGYPAESGVTSVTVVSEDGTTADGLSTSLFIMGVDEGAEYWRTHEGFDAVFITEDRNIYITEGLKDSFSSDLPYEVIKRK